MGNFGKLLLEQIEGWRLSSTGTLTGEKLSTLKESSGWVMGLSSPRMLGSRWSSDKLKSFLSYRSHFWPWPMSWDIQNLQADHISLSPGKTHSVKVFGSHITTSKNPSAWKLDGSLLNKYLAPIQLMWFYPKRTFANGNPCSINKGLSICMGGWLTQFPLKVM